MTAERSAGRRPLDADGPGSRRGRRTSVTVHRDQGLQVSSGWSESARLLVTRGQTSGAFTAVQVVTAPGWRRSTYVHHQADECFIVLEGQITVQVDDQGEPQILTPGGALYVPRGVARRLSTDRPGRIVVIQTPGSQGVDASHDGVEHCPPAP